MKLGWKLRIGGHFHYSLLVIFKKTFFTMTKFSVGHNFTVKTLYFLCQCISLTLDLCQIFRARK